MAELTKEWLLKTIAELEEERNATPGAVNEDAANALAAMKLALASIEAEPVISHVGSKNALDDIVAFIKSNRNPTLKDHNQVSERLFQDNCHGLSNHVIEYIKQIGEELEELRSTQDTAPPAPVSVPDDVSGPLAHAYKELTPTFMRNHIDVFERYGIYPDGSVGIQAMRIALDGMTRRAAMLQGAEHVTKAYKLPFEQWLSQQTGTIDVECGCVMTEVFFHWLRVAYEAGNSPVMPDGWVLVPIEPTYQMCEAMGLQWESPRFPDRYKAMLAAVKNSRNFC